MANFQLPKLDLEDENTRKIYAEGEARLIQYYKDVTTRRGLALAIIGGRRQYVQEEDEDRIERVISSNLTDDELRQLLILDEIYAFDRTEVMKIVRKALLNIAYHLPRDLSIKAAQAEQIRNTSSFTPEHNHVLNVAYHMYKGLSLDEAEEYEGLMERQREIEDNFFAQPEVKKAVEDAMKEGDKINSEIFKRLKIMLNDAFSDGEQERIKFLEAKMTS